MMVDRSAELSRFASWRLNHLQGDEKGEAQVFLERLFLAFGNPGIFEVGATLEKRVARRDNRGTAFADLVWKPRCLIEMKKAGENLQRHYRQAFEYWIDLVPNRPKYVVLCNFDEFWIYDLNLQLDEPVDRVLLTDLERRWEALGFLAVEEEQPIFRNDLVAVTREAAAKLATLFNGQVGRGIARADAQRFALQVVMALFAEDVDLLPHHPFTRAVEDVANGASAYDLLFGLFREMNTPGDTPAGRYSGTPYFNGGLFRDVVPVELTREEVDLLQSVSEYDWREVRPSIFGTLFEQSLDKAERHALGAHFTSETDIQKIVLPTIVRPWRERIAKASTLAELGAVERDLLRFRVLDPACGCGNFLYVAYRELRRIERELFDKTVLRRRRDGAKEQLAFAFVSPAQFFGIDIRPFAVEIAKVTLMLAKKLAADELLDEHQVLPLDDLDANFLTQDALIADWPAFDACIGNPPYLGRRRLITERGAAYANWLATEFPEVGGVSDYVVYWFRKAHDALGDGKRAGLVGTNTIRQGDTRRASLDYITDHGGVIYDAVTSQPWSGDAAVSVSIVNWIRGSGPDTKTLWLKDGSIRLDVPKISGALSPEVDLRRARQLRANQSPKVCFQGQTPGHEAFILQGDQVNHFVAGDSNSALFIRPYLTGDNLLHDGRATRQIIDIPGDDIVDAELAAPVLVAYLRDRVLPGRKQAAEEEAKRNAEIRSANPSARVNEHHAGFLSTWWGLSYRRADMLSTLSTMDRYVGLSRVSSELRRPVFEFVSSSVRPGDAIQVFTFADEYSFGVLQSKVHAEWFRERCSTLETRLRYTSRAVFESFPWPQQPELARVNEVVATVMRLLTYREERIAAGATLAQMYDTLREVGHSTLRDLHAELDALVVGLYGFDPQEDLLAQLLALNLNVADREGSAEIVSGPGPGELPGVRVGHHGIGM
jgi:hypothetical protein